MGYVGEAVGVQRVLQSDCEELKLAEAAAQTGQEARFNRTVRN